MSRYTVVRDPDAERELTSLWMNAVDRQTVSEASDRIEMRLARGESIGTELHEGLIQFSDGPLTVAFSVEESDRLIEIGSVRLNTGHDQPPSP